MSIMSNIKDIIRKNNCVEYLISELHCLESMIAPRFISDKNAVIRYYKKRSGGRKIDLSNPKRFSEKLQWYKLNHRDPLMQQCADKLAIREYVTKCGYGDNLNELYAVYDKVSDIDINSLPEQFVLKATHGSHMGYIVKNKSKFNWKHAMRMMNSWLHQDIAWSGREWVYKDMPRHIIAEKYLEDESGGLQDYKFFCFNGEPRFLQFNVDRFSDTIVQNFYDMDWNLLPFGKDIPSNPDVIINKPELFDEMKKIAKDLCKPFQFARVDLYQAQGKVYFGEITFFPAGGAPDFKPDEYDEIVGDMWNLVI